MQSEAIKDAVTAKVWEIVDRLPQREAIVDADARFWVEEVVGTYQELAIWHATRAGGFGGSQIGALVRNHSGQRADHEQSAHDIVAGALLRKLPDEPNGHMRRGIAMEPMHRRWFYEKHGAKRDVPSFNVLSTSTGPRPWMRYSPDDLVLMPEMRGEVAVQVRKLIDFKAPSKADEADKVAFQYVCQLHMGRQVCEHNGVSIDSLLLSQFDWANWQLKDDEVPHIPELDKMITAAGDYYWDFVLRGELPPYVHKQRLDPEAISNEVREAGGRLARLKALSTIVDQRIKALEAQVKPVLQKVRFGTSKLQLDGMSYAATPAFDEEKIRAVVPEELLASVPLKGGSTKRYDEDKMLASLRQMGAKTSEFLKPGNLDGEVLYTVLCDAGFDAESMVSEQLRATVDKKLVENETARFEREYAELVQAPEPQPQAGAEPSRNDRVGLQTPRCVPRSVAA